MIKVMIVDDMPIFREYLRQAIDWQAYGFEICAEAKNGQEALDLVDKYDPDIVLSDITMPFMDGLELAKSLKDVSDSEVVLITGNAEFEYAKQAVKLGVADYIVKPFEKEELILTLLTLKDNIEKALEVEIERQDDVLVKKDQILKGLIYTDDPLANGLEDLSSININNKQLFYVTVIETEAKLTALEGTEKASNWRSVVGSLFKDYYVIEGDQYFFKDYEGRIVNINALENVGDYDMDKEELESLIKLIKDKLNFDVTIGVGGLYPNLPGIRRSYLQALNALNNRFIQGSNQVLLYSDLSNSDGYGFYSAEKNEEIISTLNQLNLEKMISVLEEIFDQADQLRYNYDYRKMSYMGLISLLLSYVVKVGKNMIDVFGPDFRPNDVITSASDANQRLYIIDLYKRVVVYLKDHQVSESSLIAKKAKKVIDDAYQDFDFSMSHLTQKLLVNQTYLRKMFKEEYQMTINEYVVKVRMDKAKKLILEGYYKLSAVSEMVGYKDPGYFSRSFKKYFGVSPSDYKEL